MLFVSDLIDLKGRILTLYQLNGRRKNLKVFWILLCGSESVSSILLAFCSAADGRPQKSLWPGIKESNQRKCVIESSLLISSFATILSCLSSDLYCRRLNR
jgi:hypothetical protein